MVTKPKYNYKPTKEDYNTAFNQLTEEFKSRGYKHLYCSPMGCVRDEIQLQHLTENLANFQRITGALVSIVSYKQNSYRRLMNGLSCDNFFTEDEISYK